MIAKIEALRSRLVDFPLPLETQMALLDYLERLLRWTDSELGEVGCARPVLLADAAALNQQLKDIL